MKYNIRKVTIVNKREGKTDDIITHQVDIITNDPEAYRETMKTTHGADSVSLGYREIPS